MGQGLHPAPRWFEEMAAALPEMSEAMWLVASPTCPEERRVPQLCAPGARWEDGRNALFRAARKRERARGTPFRYMIFSDENGDILFHEECTPDSCGDAPLPRAGESAATGIAAVVGARAWTAARRGYG